ncbi:MAG: hypothetical protein ACLFM0_04155 [Spirochaetales bacterium]
MSVWARRLSPFVALLYAALLVWIFSLEFAGTHRVESTRGIVSVSAWVFPGNEYRGGRIPAFTLSTGWFETGLGLRDGITLRRSGGVRQTLRPLAFEATADGFRIRFEQELEIEVTTDSETDAEVTMNVIVPERLNGLMGVEVPLSPTDGSRFRQTDSSPILVTADDRQTGAISLPTGASYDEVNKRAVLPGENGTYTIHSAYQESPDGGNLSTWFEGSRSTLSEGDVEDAISGFIDTAYLLWRDERYSSEHGTWSFSDGGARFDERVAVALLAEAWTRDDYARVRSEMTNARGMHTNRTSHRLAGYLGNLDEYVDTMHEEIGRKVDRIRELVAADDPEVFRLDDPWTDQSVFNFVDIHADGQLLSQLLELAESVDPSSLGFSEQLSLFEARFRYPDTEAESTHDRLDTLDDRIGDFVIPRVHNTDDGFLVESSDGRSNVLDSLRAGQVLLASSPSDERMEQLGRHLVDDALELFNSDLLGPESLELDGLSVTGFDGYTEPVDVYPYISTNRRLPSVVSPSEPFEPGGFIWTVADVSDIQVNDNRLSFALTAPVERTHYVMVHGAPSISRVSMFGLDNWRNDSNFERYIRGRHYDPETNTLSIKYTNEDTRGTVSVYY